MAINIFNRGDKSENDNSEESNADATATPATPEESSEQQEPEKKGLLSRLRRNKNESETAEPNPSATETTADSEGTLAEAIRSDDKPAKDEPPKEESAEEEKAGLFSKLKRGLSKTSSNLAEGLGNLFLGEKDIDDELFEEIEMQLLMADVGIEATQRIIDNLTVQVSRNELDNADALYQSLKKELADILVPSEARLDINTHSPFVILMVGVNGVGKTTTIGKLARKYQKEGKSVMLAAGDTFRAAAVEQLQVWGERNNVPVIAQHTGADSASVLYDALEAAKSRGTDVLIADTAGRLQNKDNLMEELRKVVRVMQKIDPEAPHEVMLVLDAGTGQNALNQAKGFMDAVGVTGLTITKLDGTAKGGIVFAISNELGLPIRYIGVGEQVEDLRPFEARDFVKALFQQD